MSKLLDVRGRITYISNLAKQENLYAVYETTDRYYWTELARFNQQEFQKSGTEGECIEAREFIIALPESFPNLYEPDKLLQLFTDRFKEKYGVECVSALHHNKRKTNYHIHLIFWCGHVFPAHHRTYSLLQSFLWVQAISPSLKK